MRGTKILLSCGGLLAAPARIWAEMAPYVQLEAPRRYLGAHRQYLNPFTDTDLFGMFAVALTIVCYALEKHRPNMALVCALGGILAAVYGIMTDAWPLTVLEAMWAIVSLRRWLGVKSPGRRRRWARRSRATIPVDPESRIGRMFGSAN